MLAEQYKRLVSDIIRGFAIPDHLLVDRYAFEEAKHPRHSDGKFRPKGSGPESPKTKTPAPDDRPAPEEMGQQEWDFKPEGGIQVKGETDAIRDRLLTRRLDRGEDVSDEQYELVEEARKEVIPKIPRKMMKRMNKNLVDYKVHSSHYDLAHDYPQMEGSTRGVGGVYVQEITVDDGGDRQSLSGEVADEYLNDWYKGKHPVAHLDMKGRLNIVAATFGDLDLEQSMRHVLAHEMSHSTDWDEESQQILSMSDDWIDAAGDEIVDQFAIQFGGPAPLSCYAMTSPVEAWAEFGRLVILDPAKAESDFPKCWNVWKEHGLI